ncbi:tripartite motif-containing protein 16 isoform X2 [Notolabrus celidotus]|uniref:tripartite motif-containing protein 16 isoform X2 n=1 Tax=Notolabrus celidotus TaxID=1203425 RepID=UPI0014900DAA|nr:tripartite motif-containing protein 16 isoform X2 [Notolabrus celidotus]
MSDNLHKKPQVVLCDMCTEKDRKPARKTCMKCEISMCVQHLQAHLTTPVLLQTHPLTEPIASGDGGLVGITKCPQHGKLLEYYCLDDLTCVCVSCAIEDQHRLHNMKTFSTAHKELREKVTAEQQALQVKTDDESVSLEKWERSEREKLGSSSVRLIEAVTNMRDLALTSVQSSVSARMVSIKTSKSSLKVAKTEEDTFRFLQMYSQVHQDLEKAKAVNLRKGLEPDSDRDKLIQDLREKGEKVLEQASHFWGSLLTHVDPENHFELSAASSDLFFEPMTVGQGLSLSKDNRKVFSSGWQGNSTTFTFLIQGTQSSTDPNTHRWVISLPDSCDWTVGICNPTYLIDLKAGEVYGLCWKGKQLTCLQTHSEYHQSYYKGKMEENSYYTSRQVLTSSGEDTAKQMAQLKKVEVVWSSSGLLSFFSVIGQHQKRKLVSITINRRQQVTPFVSFEMEGSKNSSIQSSASGSTISSESYQQKKWNCSCGRVYPWNNNPNIRGGGYYNQTFPQVTCVCGKTTNVLHNTEVLCELL